MRPGAISLLLSSALIAALSVSGVVVSALQAPVQASSTGEVLPWDMPARSTLMKGKPVFAQYFVPHPASLDNLPAGSDMYQTELIDPTGTDGAYAAFGGAMRDRPLPRLVRPEVDWKSEDLKMEVRQAIAAGLDGFALGVLNTSGRNFDQAVALIEAAEAVDPTFKIVITPDMAGSIGNLNSTGMAGILADLTGQDTASGWRLRSSTFRLADGRVLLHPFPITRQSANYWSQVQSEYTRITGQRLALWAGFPDVKPQSGPYLPVVDGLASWGEANLTRNEEGPTGVAENATYAHNLGEKWMQPVHAFDQRPILHGTEDVSGYYGETRATEVLSRQWTGAIEGGADAVQLITWNDYSESALAPSVGHGWGPLDLSSYFLIRFKTGQYPQIRRDAVYLTHRHQFANAKPRCATYTAPKIPCTLPMTIKQGTNPAEDIVEAQTFLTAPGTVTLTVGSSTVTYQAPAGRYVKRVPLALGTVAASVSRSGSTVAEVTSPYRVVSTPEVQDMQYHIVSSLRGANVDATPPSTPGTPVVSVNGLAANLQWPASSDDTELYGYEVHRSQSATFTPTAQTRIATVKSTTFSDGGRPPGTWYYRIRAIDLAGNLSAPSTVGSAAAPGQSMPNPVTGELLADTYVNSTKVTTVYGTDPSLGSYGTPDVRTFLKFRVPPAPVGQVLTAAKLVISTTSLASAGSIDEQAVRVGSNNWTESGMNYGTRPQVQDQVIGSIKGGTVPDTGYEAWLDVNAVSQGVGGNLTLALGGTGSDGAWFVARESGVKRAAELLVQFSPAAPPPSSSTVTVQPTQDTYVHSQNRATVFGQSSSQAVDGDPDIVSYLEYPVPAAPSGKTLRSARLVMRATTLASAGTTDAVDVRVANGSFSEQSTVYGNHPATGASLGRLTADVQPNEAVAVDLSASEVAKLSGKTVTLALTGSGSDSLWLYTSESAVGGSALELTYS